MAKLLSGVGLRGWTLSVAGVILGGAVSTGLAAPRGGPVTIAHFSESDELYPHETPSDRPGICTIVYYNLCSHYTWTWGWGVARDEAGVVFDLPEDCNKGPGEVCTNTEFWWYWRYTVPGYGLTVTYCLYPVDGNFCKVGTPVACLAQQDPVERWNHYGGLGSTEEDVVAITASLDSGGRPYLVTDNNVKNQEIGCAPVPSVIRSFYYGFWQTQYCPPLYFADQLGSVNILMDATFSCEATSVDRSSWGAIKTLFR